MISDKSGILASIIVSVHGDMRLQRCLKSLTNQTINREKYEIIVIENGTNILKNISNLFEVTYLNLSQASMPAARNVGLDVANGEIVLFTDADCVVNANWVKKIVECFDTSPIELAGIGGPIKRYNPLTHVEYYGSNLVNGQNSPNYLPILPLPYIATANAAFKRKRLIEVGGFDETLLSGNDVDICYKLGLRGYNLDICPSPIVYHENRKTIQQHFTRFFKYSVYQCLLFKKYQKISNKKLILNTYPLKCFSQAFSVLPGLVLNLMKNDASSFWYAVLLMVEGFGVFLGDIYGSIKFRVLYI